MSSPPIGSLHCGDGQKYWYLVIYCSYIDIGTRVWNMYKLATYIPLLQPISPCGCGDLSVRLGSRKSPHRHQVVAEVHWRGAQGWRSVSWVVATFNHVAGSFNMSMAATGDVWIIPSFRIWGYVLHIEHISCVITNCGQLQWAIPSLSSLAL